MLVPSTLGLFVIHWIIGYLNIKMGGGLAYIPTALIYPISVISGIGPLWFIQMLCLAVIGAALYAFYYGGNDYTSSACLQNIITSLLHSALSL